MEKNENIPLLGRKMAWTTFQTVTVISIGVLFFLTAFNTGGAIISYIVASPDPLFKNNFYISGLHTGNLEIISKCTTANLSSFPDGSVKIKDGKTLEFYIPCPTPLSTCEVATCINNKCGTALASGAQCSSNMQCASLYNNSMFYCNATCQCANGTVDYGFSISGLHTGNLEIVSKCTTANLSSFPDGSVIIANGTTLEFYIPCPEPLSACEIATCVDNKCGIALAGGAQCSSNAYCAGLYNSSLSYCSAACQCVNETITVSVPSYTWFTPVSTSVTVDPTFSWYYYRYSAGVLEIMAYIDFSPVTSNTMNVAINISNIGISMISTGSYWGSKVASYTSNLLLGEIPIITIDVYSLNEDVINAHIQYSNYSLVGNDQFLSYYFVTNATQP